MSNKINLKYVSVEHLALDLVKFIQFYYSNLDICHPFFVGINGNGKLAMSCRRIFEVNFFDGEWNFGDLGPYSFISGSRAERRIRMVHYIANEIKKNIQLRGIVLNFAPIETPEDIKSFRRAGGFSQKQFAAWLGVSEHTVRRLETGKTELKKSAAFKILRAKVE